MKYAMFVMGPAGTGKSTFSTMMQSHAAASGRSIHIVNLDPAADHFDYNPSVDIRELIEVQDVMEEMALGPNGALVYCMEYLLENISWLSDQLEEYEEDYLIFDCPGQVELYSHATVMRDVVARIVECNYRVCGVYLLDSQFIADPTKFIAGTLMCLSAMTAMELPHINVLTKMDLVKSQPGTARGRLRRKQRAVIDFEDDPELQPDVEFDMLDEEGDGREGLSNDMDVYLDADMDLLVEELDAEMGEKSHTMNRAMANLIDEWGLVSFLPLDITSEESLGLVLSQIDNAIQWGEDQEVKDGIPEQNPDADAFEGSGEAELDALYSSVMNNGGGM